MGWAWGPFSESPQARSAPSRSGRVGPPRWLSPLSSNAARPPPWPSEAPLSAASLPCAKLWGLLIPGQDRANSRALIPIACNFMSHEKCLKHVRTPCASVAPSLVHVRIERGRLICGCRCRGLRKAGSVAGAGLAGAGQAGAGLGVRTVGWMGWPWSTRLSWSGSLSAECASASAPLPAEQLGLTSPWF